MKCTRTGVNWKYLTCERGQVNILVEEFEACLETQLNPDHSSPHNEESGTSVKEESHLAFQSVCPQEPCD